MHGVRIAATAEHYFYSVSFEPTPAPKPRGCLWGKEAERKREQNEAVAIDFFLPKWFCSGLFLPGSRGCGREVQTASCTSEKTISAVTLSLSLVHSRIALYIFCSDLRKSVKWARAALCTNVTRGYCLRPGKESSGGAATWSLLESLAKAVDKLGTCKWLLIVWIVGKFIL